MSLPESMGSFLKKPWRAAALAVTFLAALALRLWTQQMYFPRPAVCVSAFVGTIQVAAERSGVNLIAFHQWGEFGLQLDRATNFGRDGFQYGLHLGALGIQGAILPYSFRDYDYIVPAHIGLILPYWLLIVGIAWLLVRSLGIGNKFRFPSSRPARILAGAVLALFFVFNIIPDAGRPGAHIDPEGVVEHLQLVFLPGTLANEVHLQYGWPSRCFEGALVNGSFVDEYSGHSLGVKQHLLAENLLLAALGAWIAAVAAEWVLQIRRKPATAAPSH